MNEISSALSTGFTSAAGDLMSTLATVLPIVLGVISALIVVKFAIKFFKRNTGNN